MMGIFLKVSSLYKGENVCYFLSDTKKGVGCVALGNNGVKISSLFPLLC